MEGVGWWWWWEEGDIIKLWRQYCEHARVDLYPHIVFLFQFVVVVVVVVKWRQNF